MTLNGHHWYVPGWHTPLDNRNTLSLGPWLAIFQFTAFTFWSNCWSWFGLFSRAASDSNRLSDSSTSRHLGPWQYFWPIQCPTIIPNINFTKFNLRSEFVFPARFSNVWYLIFISIARFMIMILSFMTWSSCLQWFIGKSNWRIIMDCHEGMRFRPSWLELNRWAP